MASTRQAIACILMVVGVAVCGQSQSTSSRESNASISGKVTFQGEGVKGVIITLRSNENTTPRKLTNYRGVTDAKGEYRIANVPSGNYIVTPTATAFVVEGESNGERTLIVNHGEAIKDFDFSLMRGGVITGKVVDSDGRPLIEEEVHLFSPRGVRAGSSWPAAVTDDRGIYRIFGLRPGSYLVAAGRDDIGRSPGRPRAAFYGRKYYPGSTDAAQATVIQVSDGSEATNVDITLGSTATTYTASGRIVNGQTGQPVADVPYGVIRFFSPAQSTSVSRGAVTNSQGEFKLENLMPGQYAVSLTLQADRDLRAEEARFEIVDQDVTGLVVRTIKGGSLSGVVVLDSTYDKAISDQLGKTRLVVSVAAENARRSNTAAFGTMLRPDGNFRIGGLPTGTATFSLAYSPRFRIIRIERDGVIQLSGVEVKQGEDIATMRIVLGYADASIRGIVEVENGTIPPNGQLFLRAKKLNDNSLNASGTYVMAQIDARGQFVFDNLFPGTYELTAGVFVPGSRAFLAQTKQEVVVTAGSTTNTKLKLNLNPPKP